MYRKVINTGSINKTDKLVKHNIADVETIWCDISHSFLCANDIWYSIPRAYYAGNEHNIHTSANKTTITFYVGSAAAFTDSYITVLYTKTTD